MKQIAASLALSFALALVTPVLGQETDITPQRVQPSAVEQVGQSSHIFPEARKGLQQEVQDMQRNVRQNVLDMIQGARQEIWDDEQELKTEAKNIRQEIIQEVRELGLNLRNATTVEDRIKVIEAFEAQRREAIERLQEKMQEFRDNVAERREALRETIAREREALRERLNIIRDERKKAAVERIDESIRRLNEVQTEHFSNVIEQMAEVLERIRSRTDKAEANGLDVSAVRIMITSAEAAIDAARAAIVAQAGKTYEITFDGEDTLKADVGAVRRRLVGDLGDIRMRLVIARDAVRQAVVSLAQIPRVDELEVEAEAEAEVEAGTGETE